MPVKPVKWTTRIFQVPTNFMDQGGLLRFRQQCLPLRPGFEQPAGIRIKAAQSATQCFRQVLKRCGIEGLAIHSHLQIKAYFSAMWIVAAWRPPCFKATSLARSSISGLPKG